MNSIVNFHSLFYEFSKLRIFTSFQKNDYNNITVTVEIQRFVNQSTDRKKTVIFYETFSSINCKKIAKYLLAQASHR